VNRTDVTPAKYFEQVPFVEYADDGKILGYGTMGRGTIEDRIAMGHKLLITNELVTDVTHAVNPETGKVVHRRTKAAMDAREHRPVLTPRRPLQMPDEAE
jgi:hypothetical protein